jgi:hypothetical protein
MAQGLPPWLADTMLATVYSQRALLLTGANSSGLDHHMIETSGSART